MEKTIKKLIILMVILSSCSRVMDCPTTLNTKIKYSKTLKRTRRNLRIKYNYHQTKIGKLLNFNLI
jgi:hypothetical protein